MDDFQDTSIARPSTSERGFSARAPISETIEEGDTDGTVKNDADSFTDGGPAERSMGKAAEERIEAAATARAARKAAAQAAEEEEPDETETEKPVDPHEPPDEDAAAVKSAAVAAPAAHPDTERATRLEMHNRKLIDELDAVRKRPTAAPARLHDDAEDLYLEDSMGGLRRYVARSLGIEKLDDAKVDAELRDLYADWTSAEIGVTPDAAHQAKREAARTRQLWDREKRQRTAEEQKKANEGSADADTQKATAAAEFISPRLAQKAGDYPLLTSLAEVFDGMTPSALLWKVFERETKTGRLVLTADDDLNIANAAKLVEEHYAALVDKVAKANPQPLSVTPSTAKPIAEATAAASSASKEPRQSHGTRTLTAADASVAPATPPAKKSTTDQPPKFKSNEERKKWALRHLDK